MNEDQLSPLLNKTLKRISLEANKLPPTLESWHLFIKTINNLLSNFDQERYLLERSMELSSKEMRELYERLEVAQSIASLGYWHYDKTEERTLWSKETYKIFGLDSVNQPPSFDSTMKLVHENDRGHLSELINNAFSQNVDYEVEYRICRVSDNQIRWVYVKGHPEKIINKETTQVKLCLSGIIMDITARKKSEEDLNKLNQKLVEISRQSGMSEIATSILHNIGNVLNSVNVSASCMQNCIQNSEINKLIKISELIYANMQTQPDFLVTSEKGKLIPQYLQDLARNLYSEHIVIKKEIVELEKNIQHIKDIVAMQKDISGISAQKEKIHLSEVIENAITIGCGGAEIHGISISKNYHFTGTVYINKSKLLQILVNLIRNAHDAVNGVPNTIGRIIEITTRKIPHEYFIEISIRDNGVGIQRENLNKIFSMGYTNKAGGHGFGLHSSALAAKEMGGTLKAESHGKNNGAQFLLKIPENGEPK